MTVTFTETRKQTGDVEVIGVDDEGRRSMCLANALFKDAIAGARSYVRDDLYIQARKEILDAITAATSAIVEAARTWYRSAANREAPLAHAVRALEDLERRLTQLGPLPSSQRAEEVDMGAALDAVLSSD